VILSQQQRKGRVMQITTKKSSEIGRYQGRMDRGWGCEASIGGISSNTKQTERSRGKTWGVFNGEKKKKMGAAWGGDINIINDL